MSIIAEMARNVLNTPFEKIDTDAVERARGRLIDVVGCMLGGAHAPGCSMLVELAQEYGGKAEGTILVHGVKVPAHYAAMVNCVMARSYDFEPAGPLVEGKSTPAHLSGTTVPAAITVAEQTGATGKDLLAALILGDDMASRIIAASKLDIDSGFDSTGTVNAFGAAAIAGRLCGLNEEQMINAFGIVLNQFAGTFQNIFDGVHSFKLPQGLAAQAAIFAVALAKKGFTGVRDPLLSRYGYFALYCKSSQLEVLTRDLGKQFYGDNTCKPYPCCRSNHAAIQSTLELVHAHDINVDDIDEVVVGITPTARDFAVGQPFKIRHVPQIDAAFSLQYTVASTLLRREMKLEYFTDEFILDPKIAGIVPKVRLTATMTPDKPLGATVRIKMRQGAEYETHVDMPKGNGILTPLTTQEKRQKFLAQAEFSRAIPRTRAEEALGVLDSIETLDNVSGLIKLLVA